VSQKEGIKLFLKKHEQAEETNKSEPKLEYFSGKDI